MFHTRLHYALLFVDDNQNSPLENAQHIVGGFLHSVAVLTAPLQLCLSTCVSKGQCLCLVTRI